MWSNTKKEEGRIQGMWSNTKKDEGKIFEEGKKEKEHKDTVVTSKLADNTCR